MDLIIIGLNGNSEQVTVDHNATVGELKQLILQRFNVNPEARLNLSVRGQRINLEDDSKRLSEYGVTPLSTIAFLIINSMQVFVKNHSGNTRTYDVGFNETVDQLQHKIYNVEGVPVDQQRLIFRGNQLESGKMLQDYNIIDKSTIYMVLRLRGGQ